MRQQNARPWWMVPPPDQVSQLVGVPPELLTLALDPLPDGAPAIVRFRPPVRMSTVDQLTIVLAELDRAALTLIPRWLPDADRLGAPDLLGVEAVRALATRAAARSAHFGPFLTELAERGLRGAADGSRFPAEVRAAGLVRVIAEAYRRPSLVLLVEVPDDRTAADERALTGTAEWLVQHGRCTVWLTGAPLRTVDRVREVRLPLPAHLTRLATGATGPAGAAVGAVPPAGSPPVLHCPPLAGLPRADSAAEQALERALARHGWAHGRRWNQSHEWHLLGRPYRLDLFWAVEGLVVEVDGPEHRGPLKFADDRQRDVHLQLLGYDVLRFTNEQVLADIHHVVRQIRQLLVRRRTADRNQWNGA
ncbi:endonuclease domain-containing protein [Micromonospora echinofusca]|uniref:DUF559 domain-containing protein n=1 Tax=Micromonospora echinofusca TaxID=47858 RepID=A0ABS3VTV7_MICEH|nr:DUF559 domain-containing protein [Micromonospora echinofusca]MBO4207970.1 DUF559 domain-containing protein [Micromonospora echinofusca]